MFNEQQQLVKTLYDRTIREDLATVDILEWTPKEENSYEVKTKEVMNITINEHTEEKEYYRVYTMVLENEKLVITQLESY
ncbi:TcaA NTF2-like domain-containing protein [Priestia flexa]